MFDIPTGTYHAYASGNVTHFTINNRRFEITCENYVKGTSVSDIVTVDALAKTIKSNVLGFAYSYAIKTTEYKNLGSAPFTIPMENDPGAYLIVRGNDVKFYRGDTLIRTLDKFETNFVLSAIKATKKTNSVLE